jgi:hypothetical protein
MEKNKVTMTSQFYASDECLLGISLVRGDNETVDDRAGINELLAAMDTLASGWLIPLGVGMQFVYCDPAGYFEEKGAPERRNQLLRAGHIPANIRVTNTFFDDPVVHEISVIDDVAIRETVARRLSQPSPPGLVISLSEIWWTGVRARSPVCDEIELAAPDPVPVVSEIIDGERWCFGPTTSGQAGIPVWLRGTNSHFTTEISLEVLWDMWIGFPAGRALVDEGIERVLARGGWEYRQYFPRP